MLEFREKTIREVSACTCDRCGRRMSPEDSDGEWHERVSLAWCGGIHSLFGDCTELRLDLCQHCVKVTLGEWIRMTHRDLSDGLPDLRSFVPPGDALLPTSAVDVAYFDSLFIKATNEFVEKRGLPLVAGENMKKTKSIRELAGSVKSPVSGVSVDDMKAWREIPPLTWRLLSLATYVWDDATDADTWMRSPHPELGGRTPYEAAATDAVGAELVEAILGRILHGLPT
ncbi:MAG TPA: MbcA/ParS/Xre antitoxin family protein [Paraburkholderia sp.]|uniref:MbcA/ParS/Xre antitoxin family protein n=1 Tax=Paraburkholderia sp. TaxID=1926495 RepID=UPI002B479110|nr:MbcA/ParS/Xre antitoxin family protein [Paraburkholderia sp.]HKR40310.1 MbcA/ParS/Xre antitoxin family protein [Paraburkholderia sp.]